MSTGRSQNILTLLKSMKFAVWILIVIALVSLVSLFILEFYPINDNISGWETVYKEKYGQIFYIMKALQLQHPFRSWWYQGLLGLLSLSLLLC